MLEGSFRHLFLAASSMIAVSCANPASVAAKAAADFADRYPNQIRVTSIGGRHLRYAWSGDPRKRPILFVHGSPGSWEGWAQFLMEPKLQSSFQLIAVDRPGYGGSDEGRTEPSLQLEADLIVKALEINQSGKKAILVGHSFGGPVIAKIAMSYPDQVAGLVFVAASVDPNLEKTSWVQRPATWWPIRDLIPMKLRVCNEEILALKSELIKMLPGWSGISEKAVLIQGEDDPLVPPANLDFLIAHLMKKDIVQVARIPGLNHFVPWKRPELITSGILALAKVLRD
jgi:pimeloyl-ACP methyl ester carboxylesterase